MGKKSEDAKNQVKDLLKELKYVKKGQKQLIKRVEKLEKALAAHMTPTPTADPATDTPHGASLSSPTSTDISVQNSYPEPMKSGKYKNSYAPYRVAKIGQLTPTVMRVVAEPTGTDRAESQGLVGEYVRLITGKNGEMLPKPDCSRGKVRWNQPTKGTKYTVRSYHQETGALELNIVLHQTGGRHHLGSDSAGWRPCSFYGAKIWLHH